MIRVFIDESGSLGYRGKYFILAAAAFNTREGVTRASRLIRNEQIRLASERSLPSIEEIKSRQLTFPQRQRILTKLVSKPDIGIFYLVIDKPKVDLLMSNKPRNLIYNYFAKLLTDQIFSRYDDDFLVTFDQRSTAVKSMNSLVDYITINAYTQHRHISHDVRVEQKDSKTYNNLQVADLLAGTVSQAYYCQSRHWLEIMKPNIVRADEFPWSTFEGSLLRYDLPIFHPDDPDYVERPDSPRYL